MAFLLSASIQAEQYEVPNLEVTQREKIDFDEQTNDLREEGYSNDQIRNPSSTNLDENKQLQHWKIQDIIDRYDSH